ncbi:MAG: thioredoxin reductase [Glaciihabitans sp.]|nr:thioredoxin reductase [Glaciihabitans sp.]
MMSDNEKLYDVVIVGGSAAGLSAAVALGRARRSVLVVDGGQPRNAPADGVHNFYTRDGTNPLELVAAGRAEAAVYGAEFVDQNATGATKTDAGFEVSLAGGAVARGRRLLIATGLVDQLPDVPGLREGWGHDVIHCPYCHGWEVRDQALGILATCARGVHQALMFRQWSANITLLVNTAPDPTEEEYEMLAARGVTVVIGKVAEVQRDGGAITGVRLQDGSTHAINALVVGPRFVARADVPLSLGLELVEHPMGVGAHVESGLNGASTIPGVWLAGNVTDLMAQVVTSAAAGLMAGAAINNDLSAEADAGALAAYRARAAVSV